MTSIAPLLPSTLAAGSRIALFTDARSGLRVIVCRNAAAALGIALGFAVQCIARPARGTFRLVLRGDVGGTCFFSVGTSRVRLALSMIGLLPSPRIGDRPAIFFLLEQNGRIGICREPDLAVVDSRDDTARDIMVMITVRAAVGTCHLDAVILDPINSPDMDTVRSDDFHSFPYVLQICHLRLFQRHHRPIARAIVKCHLLRSGSASDLTAHRRCSLIDVPPGTGATPNY